MGMTHIETLYCSALHLCVLSMELVPTILRSLRPRLKFVDPWLSIRKEISVALLCTNVHCNQPSCIHVHSFLTLISVSSSGSLYHQSLFMHHLHFWGTQKILHTHIDLVLCPGCVPGTVGINQNDIPKQNNRYTQAKGIKPKMSRCKLRRGVYRHGTLKRKDGKWVGHKTRVTRTLNFTDFFCSVPTCLTPSHLFISIPSPPHDKPICAKILQKHTSVQKNKKFLSSVVPIGKCLRKTLKKCQEQSCKARDMVITWQ